MVVSHIAGSYRHTIRFHALFYIPRAIVGLFYRLCYDDCHAHDVVLYVMLSS